MTASDATPTVQMANQAPIPESIPGEPNCSGVLGRSHDLPLSSSHKVSVAPIGVPVGAISGIGSDQ
jgi:hypothetical protein